MKSFFIFTSILSLGFSATAELKTSAQYWAETGINFEFVGQFLDQSCQKSATNFVACVQTMNVVAGSLSPAAIFAAPGEANVAGTKIGALVKSYGPLNLHRVNKLDASKNLTNLWQQVLRERKAQIAAATQIFNNGSSAKIQFSAILMELRPQVLMGEQANSEGLIAGNMINAYLASAVDPHTHLDPVQKFLDEEKSTNENFAGVGAIISTIGGTFIIKTPMEGSPALKAGIRARDIIESIDGVPVTSLPIDGVISRIRGAVGSTVTFGIIRNGRHLRIPVVRAIIEIPNVQAKLVTEARIPYGYIKLHNFMDDSSCDSIAASLTELQGQGAKGMILDLRDNGGGLLEQSVCIGSLFVGKQVIVKVKSVKGDGGFQDFVGSREQLTQLPMVTLINADSASASEILSGALQDYQRSWIVGATSFGKATVQAPLRQTWSDKVVLFATIERFYEPSGRTNQIVGIVPDFTVDPKPHASEDDKFAIREADYYTNALPPLGQAWTEPRPQEVAHIEACMSRDGLAERIYEERQNDAIEPDYQLYSAESVLSCDK